jgi:hypothetical protein
MEGIKSALEPPRTTMQARWAVPNDLSRSRPALLRNARRGRSLLQRLTPTLKQ